MQRKEKESLDALQGARPKACVTDGKDLYIAKFPSTFDTWNVGRWEYFANKMAELCGKRLWAQR